MARLEAIMLDMRGYVSEGAGDNVFILKKGTLITPPLRAGVLEGITRLVMTEIADNMGIETIQRDITINELENADEAFITGTIGEIQPLIEIDGRTIGSERPGPVTKRPESGHQAYK